MTIPQRLRILAGAVAAFDGGLPFAESMRAIAAELEAPPAADEALRLMRTLGEDARVDVMSNFCKQCGSDNPSCQCWNDE